MAWWLALAISKTSNVKLNRLEMAGRWLGDGWKMPLAISSDCRCNSKSLQDGWEMTGWLAATNSRYFGCNCRSPRDGWEMAGWLALAISKEFLESVGMVGDGCAMAGRWLGTPVVLEHPIQQQYRQQNEQTHTVHKPKKQNQMAGWWALIISRNKSDVNQNQIPIVAPLGIGPNNQTYNINGDTAASAIAKKLKSRRLLLMTNVEGVYDDQKKLISEIKPLDLENLIKWKVVQGGMIPKIKNCVDAVENGVRGVVILDGRKPHSILHEIFSDQGSGTLIRK